MKPTVVIGLGSTLMSDEGVGVHLLRALAEKHSNAPGIEFHEIGTALMRALHLMSGREKAVLLDCAFMNEAPGTLRRFAPTDVRSVKSLPDLSLHEGDLFRVLRLLGIIEEAPKQIVIFGIQPASIEPGETLSPLLQERFEEYCREIERELV